MKFIHYSKEPIGTIYSKNQRLPHHFKPEGFWFSVEGVNSIGWKEWCENDEWALENLRCQTELFFHENANMLFIRNREEILHFVKEYKEELCINWTALAEKYQGIVIAPFNWEFRASVRMTWYYGWDCASGCIWDATAIESFAPVPIRSLSCNKLTDVT